MATRGSQARTECHHGRSFLFCVATIVLGAVNVRLALADALTAEGSATTEVLDACKKLGESRCEVQPTCPDKDSNFKLCADNVFHSAKICTNYSEYKIIAETIYRGYHMIQKHYCTSAEFNKTINTLFKKECLADASLCLAKLSELELGIDSQTTKGINSCRSLGNNLVECRKRSELRKCRDDVWNAATFLYNTTTCPSEHLPKDDSVTLSHLTWLLWLTLLARMFIE